MTANADVGLFSIIPPSIPSLHVRRQFRFLPKRPSVAFGHHLALIAEGPPHSVFFNQNIKLNLLFLVIKSIIFSPGPDEITDHWIIFVSPLELNDRKSVQRFKERVRFLRFGHILALLRAVVDVVAGVSVEE